MMTNKINLNPYKTVLKQADPIEVLQQQITKITAQAIHDIQSPLSCLLMLAKQAQRTTSKTVMLNPEDMVARINSILNSIPQTINNSNNSHADKNHAVIALKPTLEKILAEKQYEYANSEVAIHYNITERVTNVQISGQSNAFMRMLSNLINNAVEAYCKKSGVVQLNLDADDKLVYLTITDKGMGMTETVKNKILSNTRVTDGKLNGCGIGFGQIHDALTNCKGKLSIQSIPGAGTKITLTFPQLIDNSYIQDRENRILKINKH